jgi:hypothetical protein
VKPESFIVASGGVISKEGNFKIHTFESSDTFKILQLGSADNKIEYLVVGGGAGGSGGCDGYGAGGGGGIVLAGVKTSLSKGDYFVKIGAGGKGTAFGVDCSGVSRAGGVSSVFSVVAAGGAAFLADKEANGGSNLSFTGGLGCCDVGFGNSGGGGAGAASNGKNAGITQSGDGGDGGDGLSSIINGISVFYGGGGGGSGRTTICGKGGKGGGGNGGINPANPSTAGVNGLGGGGGGSANSDPGKNGGSGIVILRYRYK